MFYCDGVRVLLLFCVSVLIILCASPIFFTFLRQPVAVWLLICSMMYSSVAGTADAQLSSGAMHLFFCFRD